MPSGSTGTEHDLQCAHREHAAAVHAAVVKKRAAQKLQWQQKRRAQQRWQKMMSFGMLVLASVSQTALPWIPALIERFELTADAEEVEEKLGAKFLATSAETLAEMLNPSSLPNQKLLKDARAFAVEMLLTSWVCQQNVDKGVTPTVGDIIQQRAHELAAMHGSCSSTLATSFELSAEYKWSKSFRKRWKLGQGKTAEREEVPLHEMRTKA